MNENLGKKQEKAFARGGFDWRFFYKGKNSIQPTVSALVEHDRLVRDLTQGNFKQQENQQHVDTILPFIYYFFMISFIVY